MYAILKRFLADPRTRLVVRIVFSAAVAVVVWTRFAPSGWRGLLPSVSPFVALLSLCAGAGGWFLAGALPLALAAVFSPRFFCRWLCPAGLCQEVAGRIGSRLPGVRVGAWSKFRCGYWLLGIGIGAALLGYPLFLCLDPLVLFTNGWGVALLVALALVRPGFWCGNVCPLGALQDLLRQSPRLRQTSASRRMFLQAAGGAVCGAVYRLALPVRPADESALRPPCVPDEAAFLRLCARCGACVRACPAGILRHAGTDNGVARILAPEVRFGEGVCDPSCTVCGTVCPTGAIPRFTAEQKRLRPIGIARVDPEGCLAANGMECGVCVRSCPFEAMALQWEASDMQSLVTVDAGRCVGCGVCVNACPADPRAVSIHPLPAGEAATEGTGKNERNG
ncbi:MAG: 4Fe-4S dicluster domain-containing protein [Kiritimatiellae bacterium]|nr:4Fe-4S dicluster domain-containing protein [Kiritimatiellia bacterium]